MSKSNFKKNANRWNYYERRFDSELNDKLYNLKGLVYNFGIADINYKSPAPIRNGIINRAKKGTYSYSFTPDKTLLAIQSWYQNNHKVAIKKEWIKIVHGTVNAMNQIVQAFTLEDDYVLIQTPIYKPFADAILNNHRQVADNRLIFDEINESYKIDLIDFEKQIIEKKIKLFMLCNPHNPGAVVWDFRTLNAIVEICEKHQVIIFSDEVHSDIVFKPFTSILKFEYDNVILANSPNKIFNLGGLKASYLIVKKGFLKDIIDTKYQKNYLTSLNVFVNVAFQEAYLNPKCQEWLKELKNHIWDNFIYIKRELTSLNYIVFDLQSTYLIWVKLPGNVDELVQKLKDDNIVICDYNDFYNAENNYMRINIATSKSDLEHLVNVLNVISQKYK